jgi:hypothetical protein
MDVGFDGADRSIEKRGNFIVAAAVHVAQHDRHAVA